MNEFVNLLKEKIFNDKSSFTTTFITSWALWNWEVILWLFSSVETYWKIAYIQRQISFFNELVMPFVIASLRYFILSYFILYLDIKYKKIKDRLDMENKYASEIDQLKNKLQILKKFLRGGISDQTYYAITSDIKQGKKGRLPEEIERIVDET